MNKCIFFILNSETASFFLLLKLFDFQMKNNLFQFIDLSNFKDIIKLDRECYFLKFDLKGMGL